MSTIQAVNSQNFQKEVLESPKPVLVDFWAQWCRPCLMLAPMLEKAAAKLANRLSVFKLNVEENQDIAGKYQIMSIPCLVVFRQGREIGRIIGYMDDNALSIKIEEIINKGKV